MSKSIVPGILFRLPQTLFDPTLTVCVHNLDDEAFYPFAKLCYIEAAGRDSKLYFTGRKNFVLSTLNLKVYEDRYCPQGLVRVSRQHIVSPRYIDSIGHVEPIVLTLKCFRDILIPVSAGGIDRLRCCYTNALPPVAALPTPLIIAQLQAAWLQGGGLVPFHYFR